MTKNHNHKRPIQPNKDFPGCMGGILNLFDFNQAYAGRRLITNKRHADGLEAPRNSLDVSLETPQSSEVKNEDIPYAYEMKKVSTTKKKTAGMPMKALIAQEMSKEMESKRRTPSVVARLMGLDPLPAESTLVHHIKAAEIHPQKNISGKQQQRPKSARDVHFFSMKSKAQASNPRQELPLPKPCERAIDHQDQKASLGTLPFRDHPQEQQLQEFKKEFEAWQASKIQDCPKAVQLDELNLQLVEKQMLVREKLNEAKMALVREKFIDAKRLATDEKLQQSKEFLDALEILQSNKELFLKFLQEPNSLFSKHPQDIQSTLQLPSQRKQLPKMKSSSIIKEHEVFKEKDDSHIRRSKERKNEKRLQKQKGPRISAEREEPQQERASSPEKSVSVCSMHDQHEQYPAASSEGKNNIGILPTRIVVLKPGPGRPQNFRLSPSPSCSPRSQTGLRYSGEGERGSTQDFLQEVRDRLKLGITENRKDESRITEGGVRDQFHDGPKDPKQIARQIARQVRESVTRDLANDPSRLGDVSTLIRLPGKKSLLNRLANPSGAEIPNSVTNHSWDYTNRFSPSLSSSLSRPSSSPECVNREGNKFVSERLRFTQGDEEEQHLRRISNTLGKMLAFPEEKKHVTQSKSSQQKNKGTLGDEEDQLLSCQMHENRKIKRPVRHEMTAEWEGSSGEKNGDDNRNISPRSLLRSRSVPVSGATFDRDTVDKQNEVSCVNTNNMHETIIGRTGSNFPAEFIKGKNERSIFKGRVSSLKGSFLLRGRRSRNKKSASVNTMPPNNYLEIRLDKERCDLLQELPMESNGIKERSDDLPVLVHHETCKQLVDAPDMATEPVEHPACCTHEASIIGDKSSEVSFMEASNLVSDSVETEANFSGVDTNFMTEAILPGQLQPSSPSPCSPTKELPVHEPSSSENNNEKCEQPSPVSVLDSPFQEEISSPKGFKEISSNLQELRLRLRLIKFDGSEGPRHESDTNLQVDSLVLEDHDVEESCIVSEKSCNSPSEEELSCVLRFPFSVIENEDIESAIMNDISCPKEKRADLLYIGNVLVASGFTRNRDLVFAQCHSPSHPLDPCLYEKMEDCYVDNMQCQTDNPDNELSKTVSAFERKAHRSQSERHLIFDCINEVLLDMLGPFSNPHPWVRPTKRNLQPMPAGKQLLEQTWRTICHYLYPQSDSPYTLENLVAKDLARGTWMDMEDDVEMVGVEVEKIIFSDMIEEVLCDLVCRV